MNIRQNRQWIIDIVENNKTTRQHLERYRTHIGTESESTYLTTLTAKVNIALTPYHLGMLRNEDVEWLFK
jgi:hypothetical protein